MLNKEQKALLNKIKESQVLSSKLLDNHEEFIAGQLLNKGLIEIEIKETFIGTVINYVYLKG